MEAGGRLDLYRYYLHLIPSNPFGIGFNYSQKFGVDLTYHKQVGAHSSIFELWMFGGFVAIFAAAAVLVFAVNRAARELSAMAPGGGPAGVAYVSYLGAAVALVSFWIETMLIGSPFDETINSVLLALVLAGVSADGGGEGRIPIRALETPITWLGYFIMLGLVLRAALG